MYIIGSMGNFLHIPHGIGLRVRALILMLLFCSYSFSYEISVSASGSRFFYAGTGPGSPCYADCSFSFNNNIITVNAYDGGSASYSIPEGSSYESILGNHSFLQVGGGASCSGTSNSNASSIRFHGNWSGSSGAFDTQMSIFCSYTFEITLPPDTASNSCPAESFPPALLRQSLPDNYEEPPVPDYSLDWSSKSFYDARGRRTQADPNTRRFLFEKGNKSAVRGTEPGMVELLRDSPSSLCCVEEGSFRVQLRDEDGPIATDLSGDNKFGVKVKFNAEFVNGNGCDPKCCEFRQEVKAKIFKNSVYDTDGNCGILDSTRYVPDCYGRGCNNSSDKEEYNDLLGTYSGKDFPGLRVMEGDSIDVKMEFNSHIVDICPNPYYIKETKYWGFHIQGVATSSVIDISKPNNPVDSLEVILLGEIDQ